jgi:hypothetical protein
MTRRIFDFKCSDDHVNESFIDESITEVPCKTCGNVAFRIVSPVTTMFDAVSGDFPTATMKWAKNRQRKINQENKANSD